MDTAARARLDRWMQSLIAKAERLLDVGNHGIVVPGDPVRLAEQLAEGTHIVVPEGSPLTELRRATRDALADGEHVLWLGFGMLTWVDRDLCERVSPLVLWPVRLDGNRVVAATDRIPRLNEVLAARLRADYDLTFEATPELDLAGVLTAAAEFAGDRAGWTVAADARLATYSFADFDMWRDLVTRTDELSAPMAWLLGMESPRALTDPSPQFANPGSAGMRSTPDQGVRRWIDAAMPLDADASQCAAVHAAASGHSFVLQGPPGTGKSQTIANIAAHCTSQGMSVLVVSDRISALEAVEQRLSAVGLEDVCTVAGAPLQRTARRSRPYAARTASASHLVEAATVLDQHVSALHDVTALGLSVHDVLARLVELRTTPNAALAEPDAVFLDRATFERRRTAVGELAAAAAAVQPATTHPWRESELGACDGSVPPGARGRVVQALETAAETTAALTDAIADTARLLPGLLTRTQGEIRAVGELAELAAISPRPGAELFSTIRGRSEDIDERIALIRVRGGGDIDVPRDPASFIALATRHRALVAEIGDHIAPDCADGLDAPALWIQMKKWTSSAGPLRFVALRSARAQVRAAALPMQLRSDDAIVDVLEAVIAERACRQALEDAAEPAKRWFGELWRTARTGESAGLASPDPSEPWFGDDFLLTLDVAKLDAAIAWATDLRRAFERVGVVGGETARQTAWRALIAQVVAPTTNTTVFSRVADTVSRWVPAIAELAAAAAINPERLGSGDDHLAALRAQIDALVGAADRLGDWIRFDVARRQAIDAGMFASVAAIHRGDLDAADLAPAWERATLLNWLAPTIARNPKLAQFDGGRHHATAARFADLDRGAMALAPGRLSRLAPCVLATPQAIARCALPIFDLVVIDEASRLPVANALGALTRGRELVVVGDSNQPRPIDGADSILDLAIAAQLPQLALSTHYRSRHHELFAFANQHIYGDSVGVLPAAHRPANVGVQWLQAAGSAGAAGENLDEAQQIVSDIAKNFAQGRQSIAVAVLARAQQDLIEDLLEAALPVTTGQPRVLVGTPDRLQGEERDLVYLSIGYGAQAVAAFASTEVERWLNIATTRARNQLVVVSSFAADEVPNDAAASARSIADLIGFAQRCATSDVGDAPAVDAITEAIGRAMALRGWTVRHRFGAGRCAVELAVLDPDDPQRCVLAIEHDGAAYAAADGARDRDRLRDQQLVRLGWRIHRVWSLDWWNNPEREIQRAHAAIVTAVAAGRQRGQVVLPATAPSRRRLGRGSAPVAIATSSSDAAVIAVGSGPTIATEATDQVPLRLPRGAIAIGPYTAAAIPCGRRLPDDMFAGRHCGELAKVVEQVLAAEAPIHVGLLSRRTAAYFGVGRLTSRITDQVRSVLEGRGRFGDEPDIVWRADQDPSAVPSVRVAGSNAVACRDIVEIPLLEVAAAARIVVERASGIEQPDLVRDCARLLGFARITDRVSERVARGVQLAARRELIAIDDGRAHLTV